MIKLKEYPSSDEIKVSIAGTEIVPEPAPVERLEVPSGVERPEVPSEVESEGEQQSFSPSPLPDPSTSSGSLSEVEREGGQRGVGAKKAEPPLVGELVEPLEKFQTAIVSPLILDRIKKVNEPEPEILGQETSAQVTQVKKRTIDKYIFLILIAILSSIIYTLKKSKKI